MDGRPGLRPGAHAGAGSQVAQQLRGVSNPAKAGVLQSQFGHGEVLAYKPLIVINKVSFGGLGTDQKQLPRAKKLGIWQSKTQTPWEYRARRWETTAQITSGGSPRWPAPAGFLFLRNLNLLQG